MRNVLVSIVFGIMTVGVANAECPTDLRADQLITCINKEGAGVAFGTDDNPDLRSEMFGLGEESMQVAKPTPPSDPEKRQSEEPALADQ